MKKHYYVYVQFSKNCMRKYFYQYCDNKQQAIKLLSTLKKQNKSLIGWVDFVWDNDYKTLPGSILHGTMYNKTESLMQEVMV